MIFLEYHTAEFSLKLSFPENVKIIVDLNKNKQDKGQIST